MSVLIIGLTLLATTLGGVWFAHRRSLHLGAVLGIGLSLIAFSGVLTLIGVDHIYRVSEPKCLSWYEVKYDSASGWSSGYCQAWWYPPGYSGKPLPVGPGTITSRP